MPGFWVWLSLIASPYCGFGLWLKNVGLKPTPMHPTCSACKKKLLVPSVLHCMSRILCTDLKVNIVPKHSPRSEI